MSTVTLINFKRAKGLNHGPFHSFLEETDSGHGTVPYHTEAQWPNPAKVLIYVVAWGRECHHRASGWKWRRDLAFLWDITKHMMQWQLSRQSCACGTLRCSKETSVTLYWQDIFSIWPVQLSICSWCRKSPYKSPNAANRRQCNNTLKAEYANVGAAQFPSFIPATVPQLCLHAAQMHYMLGSNYVSGFSVVKMNKNPQRSRLTDAHLHSISRVSTPNTDELAAKKRGQASGFST